MRFIPTAVHGPIDYVVGLLLVFAPWAGGFAAGGAETWVPVALGVLTIGASLLTDYEWGVVRLIPVPTHLTFDLGSGMLLAASPWLFGFADRVWGPHLLVGLFEIAAALCTQTVAGRARGPAALGAPGRAY